MCYMFKIDLYLRISAVLATATWLAGGCHTPVLYQNG